MSFTGFKYQTKYSKPKRSLNGFYGFKITLDLVGIKITDFRGRGLANVTVIAENLTSGLSFEGLTDSNGSVFMQLDTQTKITIKKDMLINEVQYNGEISPVYEIDLPFLE